MLVACQKRCNALCVIVGEVVVCWWVGCGVLLSVWLSGVGGVVVVRRLVCFLAYCCMTCAQGLVGYWCLLGSHGLLSIGHLVLILHHRASTLLLCPLPAWLLCDMQNRSVICLCVFGVVFLFLFHIDRSVMGCGAVFHRLGRCVVV